MPVTDEQVAMLRAFLAGDDAEYDRLGKGSDPADYQVGYQALVATAFVKAVNRRFGKNRRVADIVQFVAHVRARYVEHPDLLDPFGAELLIQSALGDRQAVAELDEETKARGQAILLPALIDGEGLDDVGLDQLLTEARREADNLSL